MKIIHTTQSLKYTDIVLFYLYIYKFILLLIDEYIIFGIQIINYKYSINNTNLKTIFN